MNITDLNKIYQACSEGEFSKIEMNLTEMINISQTCSVDGIFSELPLGAFALPTTMLTFFLNRLGSILCLGLVHYEKFGQDSQKRHVTDRIFSFNILQFLLCYLIRGPIVYFFD